MATLAGIENILLFRIEGEEGSAWKLAYQTEHELTETRDFETTETKDGAESSAGAYEGSFSASSLMAQDDEYVSELKEIVRERNPRKVHVWDIETDGVDQEGVSTIPGDYALCNLTDFTKSSPVDGNVELSLDFTITGRPYSGEVDVTPELLAIIRSIDEDREFIQPMETAE